MISRTDAASKRYDVCGIGSPLLDFIVEVDDGLLAEIDMQKGHMHLIDEEQSRRILGMIEKGYRVKTAPGGSSANTLACVSALGGSAVFLGKIGDDYHGTVYEQSTVDCRRPVAAEQAPIGYNRARDHLHHPGFGADIRDPSGGGAPLPKGRRLRRRYQAEPNPAHRGISAGRPGAQGDLRPRDGGRA